MQLIISEIGFLPGTGSSKANWQRLWSYEQDNVTYMLYGGIRHCELVESIEELQWQSLKLTSGMINGRLWKQFVTPRDTISLISTRMSFTSDALTSAFSWRANRTASLCKQNQMERIETGFTVQSWYYENQGELPGNYLPLPQGSRPKTFLTPPNTVSHSRCWEFLHVPW